MQFIRIADPDKPGDYLVVAKRDFNPAEHKPFEPNATPAPAAAPTPATSDVPPPAAPPAGASVKNIAELTVAQAIPVIEAAASIGELLLLQQQEAGRPSPRTGVLKALQAKIDAFSAQDE
jgi:pyruvate dehydrogenase E2 component (dihydrolipoamide acetyltransferase)